MPDLGDVLLHLMFSNYRDQGPYVTYFWYPDEGIGRIAERMAEEIVKSGSEVRLGHKVERIHLAKDRATTIEISNGNGAITIPCQQVFSTIPLPELVKRIVPADRHILEAVKNIEYRALIFVFVILSGNRIGEDHWLYFPEKGFLFNRISEPAAFSPSHSPPGKTSLCVEITCQEGDALWTMPEEILYEYTVRDLARAELIDPDQVEELFTYRLPYGYPIYSVDYENHLARILTFVDHIDNLVTFGRQGGFDYSNMSESIASGLEMSESIVRM